MSDTGWAESGGVGGFVGGRGDFHAVETTRGPTPRFIHAGVTVRTVAAQRGIFGPMLAVSPTTPTCEVRRSDSERWRGTEVGVHAHVWAEAAVSFVSGNVGARAVY